MTPGPVRYARSGDVNIAYQLCGTGPVDLVFVMGWVSHLEYFWKEPSFARFLGRLASFSRLILFDKRGTGLSDPVTRLPTLEQRMDDVRAVLEAAGSKRAVLLGVSEGGPMCSLFAATHPGQTEALIMISTYARRLRAPDYPWAPTREQRERFLREIIEHWGGPVGLTERAPSVANDPAFRDWWASLPAHGRQSGSGGRAHRDECRYRRSAHPAHDSRPDARPAPRGRPLPARWTKAGMSAKLIPDAQFVALPGDDHLPFVGDQEAMLDEIERFLARARSSVVDADRVLVTVLCADGVAGSRKADTRDPSSAVNACAISLARTPRGLAEAPSGSKADASTWSSTDPHERFAVAAPSAPTRVASEIDLFASVSIPADATTWWPASRTAGSSTSGVAWPHVRRAARCS